MIDNGERMKRIRARAQAHGEAIESASWFTPSDLAAKWQTSQTTVYMIPREHLPYKEFGVGKRPRRRYAPAAVAAFEAENERYTTPRQQSA